MLFRSSRWFERREHDSRLAEFFNFLMRSLFLVRDCSISLRSTRSLFALKTSFQALKRRCDRFKTEYLVGSLSMFLRWNRF